MNFYQQHYPPQFWAAPPPTPPGRACPPPPPPPPMHQQPMLVQYPFPPQPYFYPSPLPSPTMGYCYQPMQYQQQPQPLQPMLQQTQQRMPSRRHSSEVLVTRNRAARPLVPPGHHTSANSGSLSPSYPSMVTIAEEPRRPLADDHVPLAMLASRNKGLQPGQRRSVSYTNLRTNRSSPPHHVVRLDPSCTNTAVAAAPPRHSTTVVPSNNAVPSGPPSLTSSRFSSTASSSSSSSSSLGEASPIASTSVPKHTKPSIAKRLMKRLSRSTSTSNIQQHHRH